MRRMSASGSALERSEGMAHHHRRFHCSPNLPINEPHASAGYLQEDPPTRAIALEDIVNVLLFAPFGWGVHCIARHAGMRAPLLAAAVACSAFSVSIESVQYFLPYPYSSLTDVLTNTLGGLLGAWASCKGGGARYRQRRTT